MKRSLAVALCVAAFALLFRSLLPAGAQGGDPMICPGFLPSRLAVGARGQVTPGPANNLRAGPSANTARVGWIPGGRQFTVLEGPICGDGGAWWRVDFMGIIGWTLEGQGDTYWVDPVIVPTPVPQPTPFAVPQVQPPAASDDLAALAGVTLPPGVESEVSYSFVPAVAPDNPDYAFWEQVPAHLILELPDLDGRITIYRADHYEQYFPESMEALGMILDAHLSDDAPEGIGGLVVVNAVNIFRTREATFDLADGDGALWRMLTQFAQGVEPMTDEVVYLGLGLAGGGRYFVHAWFTVHSSLYRDNDADAYAQYGLEDDRTGPGWDAFIANLDAYYADVAADLDAAAPETFTPRLEALDAVLQSLWIDPAALEG